MKIRSLVAVVLVCALCFTLCACGISKDEAVGTWSGSYSYEGNAFSVAFVLSADGEYTKLMYKNGAYYKAESGTGEIEGGDVLLHENGNEGVSTIYKYKGDALVNNDHKYYKK